MKRTEIKRRTPVKKRNPKRKASEFKRCYGSKERVEFVKSLPCVWCLSRGDVQNAHTVGDGMGRKAGYATIAALCSRCHFNYDNYLSPFNKAESRVFVRMGAQAIHARWLEQNG